MLYERIPYASEQGNFSSPCRELKQAITESLGRIRDEGAAIGRPGFLAAWRQIISGTLSPANLSGRAGAGNLIGTR